MENLSRTQISGKYALEDQRLFTFKRKLLDIGVEVTYPVGEGIIGQDKFGFAYTHSTELSSKNEEIEFKFLKSVRQNPFHIVFNMFGNEEGRIGHSASVEILMAMREKKPIILIRDPRFSDKVPDEIIDIIRSKLHMLNIHELDKYTSQDLKSYLDQIYQEKVDYELTPEESQTIIRNVVKLLKIQREMSELK